MTDFLLLAFIFLAAGVVSVPVASRLGLGSVLGYLIAGIVISPLLSFLHVDVISIQHFAEFGVVMMLFLIGLELEPKMLWKMRGRLVGLGGGQVAGTTILVMGCAMALGQPWTIALAIGFVLALSSTAIVLQTLGEKGLMKSDGGQASFSVLLFQDIAVIPMLAIMPLLAIPELADMAGQAGSHGPDKGGAGHGNSLSLVDGLTGWQTALMTVGAVALVVVAGNYLTRPIFRFIASAKLRELFTAAALMMVVGIALLMTLVGLSPALGTFLAGVVLANSEYRHELESDIEPFKGLLLGLFFITVGAGINFALLKENFGNVVALTLGLIALKAVVLFVLAFIFKIRGQHKWLFALGLAQAGEFGFVLLSFAVAGHIIPKEIADQLLLVVALSMLLTPGLFIFYDKVIAPRFNQGQLREADAMPEDSHIIIAGRGRVGGIAARMLENTGYRSTIIDFSSRQLELLRKFGAHAYFGDATRPDLLHSAGIDEAKILIIAIDNKEQISQLTKYAIENYPNLHVIARAVDRMHVYDLWAHGCRDIIRESYDSSLRMGRSAFEALGASRETANLMTAEFRNFDQRMMVVMAEAYDTDIPVAENEAFLDLAKTIRKDWEPVLLQRMKDIMENKPPGDLGPKDYGRE